MDKIAQSVQFGQPVAQLIELLKQFPTVVPG
jgi:hypothetical protein